MDWLIYLACITGGAFFVNGVPHFVAGIMGRKFHSPFARPFGKGLSSPFVNVIWGFVNFGITYVLLMFAHAFDSATIVKTLLIAVGAIAASLALAVTFGKWEKQ